MDTLNTIVSNFQILWDAPKDWSVHGGLAWLTGYLALMALWVVAAGLGDLHRTNQREAKIDKKLLYAEAQLWGQVRLERQARRGYSEYRRIS